MIEDLIEIFIREFEKKNLRGICVLASWLFNQYVPDSKINKGFLIRKSEYYCLHMWIEYENKIYDIRNMYKKKKYAYDTASRSPPQYTIEEPIRLENKADNHKEFSLQLKHFDPSFHYQNAPQNIKKCIKSIERKVIKKTKYFRFRNSQTFCRINLPNINIPLIEKSFF